MKKISLMAAVVLAAGFLTTTSCKKKDKDESACRLTNARVTSPGDTSNVTLSYDGDKRLSRVQTSYTGLTLTTTFTYDGDTIRTLTQGSSGSSYKNTVGLDGNGRVVLVRRDDSFSPTFNTTTIYEYNGGQLSRVIDRSPNNPDDITNVEYSNGNVVKATGSSFEQTFDYYTDQPFQIGDFFYYGQYIELGALGVVNRNLLKTINDGGTSSDIINFTYQFDDRGNISQMFQKQDNYETAYDYQYQCD